MSTFERHLGYTPSSNEHLKKNFEHSISTIKNFFTNHLYHKSFLISSIEYKFEL